MIDGKVASGIRGLLLVLILPLLSGCLSTWHWEYGTPLSVADAPDESSNWTMVETFARLGPPVRMSATTRGSVLAWEYWQIDETSFGFSLGAAGAEFLSADWGTARAKGFYLMLDFDHQHNLIGASWAKWDRDAGGGRGVQPLFGFVSVVDVRRPDRTHAAAISGAGIRCNSYPRP